MRLIFMGTPAFAEQALRALHAAGHEIVAVYSQPPRPANRGQQLTPSPVHRFAQSLGLPVHTPLRLKGAEEQALFAAHDAEVAVVAAYGLILPEPILRAPGRGCLNIHASLLPRWRGAAPIQRAIEAGDAETGVTIMQMDKGLDTGAMLLKAATPIGPDDSAGLLHDRLADLGARLIVEALDRLDTLSPEPQPAEGATYAAKIDKAESRIDWRRPAIELERRLRAFNPTPGCWFLLAGERIRLLSAEVIDRSGTPGDILDERLTIACGDLALRPLVVQRAGRAAMPTDALLRGMSIAAGTRLA